MVELVEAQTGVSKFTVHVPGARVPNLQGLSKEAAEAAIQKAGLAVQVAGTSYTRKVPSGHVAAYEPSSGTVVRLGAAVKLTLSGGVQPGPTASGPGGGTRAAMDEDGFITCSWSAVSGATEYHVLIKHPRGGNIYNESQPADSRTARIRPTWSGDDWSAKPYTWQVRAKVNDEWGEWSEERTFLYARPGYDVPKVAVASGPPITKHTPGRAERSR